MGPLIIWNTLWTLWNSISRPFRGQENSLEVFQILCAQRATPNREPPVENAVSTLDFHTEVKGSLLPLYSYKVKNPFFTIL